MIAATINDSSIKNCISLTFSKAEFLRIADLVSQSNEPNVAFVLRKIEDRWSVIY